MAGNLHALARRHLARRDRILRDLMREVGPCTLWHNPDHFAVLVASILSQQISTRAAAAIRERLVHSLGQQGLTPQAILRRGESRLRSAGLSAAKARALLDLAAKVRSGDLPLPSLAEMSDDEVVDRLLPVRGIGRWTAQMFLIFSLGRADVLPVDDWGLRVGAQRRYSLTAPPGRDELERLAQPWRPYRTVATWYLWRSLGFVPQSEG